MTPKTNARRWCGLTFAAAMLAVSPSLAQTPVLNDYPTVARADYIFGCMSANGQSRAALEDCACSIDHIARLVPYDEYVKAETILRTIQVGGEKVAPLRNSARHKKLVSDMRRAQTEADILCFQG